MTTQDVSPYELILKELARIDRTHASNRASLLNQVPRILRAQTIIKAWEAENPERGSSLNVWSWTTYVTLRFAPDDSISDVLLFLEEHALGLDLSNVQSNDSAEIHFMWKGIQFCLDTDPSQKCKIVEVSRFEEIRDRRIVCL